jgi:hypothetical protein
MLRSRLSLSLLVGCAVGCSAGLRDGVVTKGSLRYRVGPPNSASWRKFSLHDNDAAWTARDSGHVMAVNSTCADHGDPSLDILTNHLVMGFTDRALDARAELTVDGRQALRSFYRARLDGVPVELELLVLKKNGCVHDFSYISPLGQKAALQADFDRLVQAFHQEAAP